MAKGNVLATKCRLVPWSMSLTLTTWCTWWTAYPRIRAPIRLDPNAFKNLVLTMPRWMLVLRTKKVKHFTTKMEWNTTVWIPGIIWTPFSLSENITFDWINKCSVLNAKNHDRKLSVAYNWNFSAYAVPWFTWDNEGSDEIIDQMDELGLEGYLCVIYGIC